MNRLGNLIFNEEEKNDPHMQRMHDQMIGFGKSKTMDGPDGLEGAVWIILNRVVRKQSTLWWAIETVGDFKKEKICF
uniref:Uncharacterized protein n=1 Tax=Flavobacterium columnare TaxID=996 RepID=A0AA94EYT9_9FLAO